MRALSVWNQGGLVMVKRFTVTASIWPLMALEAARSHPRYRFFWTGWCCRRCTRNTDPCNGIRRPCFLSTDSSLPGRCYPTASTRSTRSLSSMPAQGAAVASFRAVFEARCGHGLPLHVVWPVSSACAQRLFVIDDMAGALAAPQAGRGAGVGAFECEDGGG